MGAGWFPRPPERQALRRSSLEFPCRGLRRHVRQRRNVRILPVAAVRARRQTFAFDLFFGLHGDDGTSVSVEAPFHAADAAALRGGGACGHIGRTTGRPGGFKAGMRRAGCRTGGGIRRSKREQTQQQRRQNCTEKSLAAHD